MADKLFCNFSLFQSLPDVWAINQIFPIVPLQRLNELPTERGDSADELLMYIHFQPRELLSRYRRRIDGAGLERAERERLYLELKAGL